MNNVAGPVVAFFGTSRFSVLILEELAAHGFLPTLVVTSPDKPQGRKLLVAPPPAKIWADEHKIASFQPADLRDPHVLTKLRKQKWDVFVVASYGKIIPHAIFDIPLRGTLNVHPSLLPHFRGPSPIQSMILGSKKNVPIEGQDIGVSIMQIDELMDHGAIVAQKKVVPETWPIAYLDFEALLAMHGGKLLSEVLPSWVQGKIKAAPQDHSQATYTKKIEKSDGLIDLADDAYQNWLKINAYSEWPGCYFVTSRKEKEIRVIVTDAKYEDEKLSIVSVKPEGGKEMSYQAFQNGL